GMGSDRSRSLSSAPARAQPRRLEQEGAYIVGATLQLRLRRRRVDRGRAERHHAYERGGLRAGALQHQLSGSGAAGSEDVERNTALEKSGMTRAVATAT